MALSFFALSESFVSAKSVNSQGKGGNTVVTEASGSGIVVKNRITTLEKVESKVKNPQAKTAIQNAIQIAEQSEATAESSLNEMAGRPGFLKFIVGPDYKNAGQVRSEIVRLRNQINQLTRTRTREGLSTTDQAGIDTTIAALQTDLTSIETRLNDALKGVSLFGWLGRLLNGFVAPSFTPVPSIPPTASPTVSASPSATITPVPTTTPIE